MFPDTFVLHNQLIEAAKKAQDFAYTPYSNFSVGAALITKNGHIFSGCNMENHSFGLTCCAERTAIFKMVSEKGPEEKIHIIAITTKADVSCSPCGCCRQVIQEFSTPDTMVIYKSNNKYKSMPIDSLLTDVFKKINSPNAFN